jgi:hypothetical protein
MIIEKNEITNEYNMSGAAADFVQANDTGDNDAQIERTTLILERGELYSLHVENVATGSNEFGEWMALNLVNGTTVYFNGFEAKDVARAIDKVGSPETFDISVVRVLKDSIKNPGRQYSAAIVEVFATA